ncbi:MAG: hypothetical protein V4546_07710 [Bacteroidota bacterium]
MIKQEDLFKKLGLILNELNDQYQYLSQNPQQFNELELELFHANANFLADHVQIIKKLNAKPQTQEAETIHINDAAEFNPLVLPEDTHEENQLEEITFAENNDKANEAEVVEENEIYTAKVNSDFDEELVEEPVVGLEEIEKEVFKLDSEPSTFEFILNDHSEHEILSEKSQTDSNDYSSLISDENSINTDEKFEFEEKSVEQLFNRPLSDEEERVLAEKIKLREQLNKDEAAETDEDEIGPEPFLVKIEENFPIEKEELTLAVAPVETVEVNNVEPVEDPTYKATLNDLLAKSRSINVNTTNTAKISDLKQAINLNDKLLYIKDLFNGYNLAYAEAIDLANKLPDFESAHNFFQKNYAVKNNWTAKQATVDKFYELLNQRFR